MRLARTLRFDDSDERVFEHAAEPGEWAISGAFEFSNWAEADLTGKRCQAFANGWLGLESFGRATFVAAYGAPDLAAARPVAEDELRFMAEMCADHDPNTLLVVNRELVAAGVGESFRAIKPAEATIDMVAIHGTPDPN